MATRSRRLADRSSLRFALYGALLAGASSAPLTPAAVAEEKASPSPGGPAQGAPAQKSPAGTPALTVNNVEIGEDMLSLGTHEHGKGDLNVSVDENMLLIDLMLPMLDAVGFERAPKNDAEKKKVTDTLGALKDPFTMFTIPKSAGCKIESADVIEPDDLADSEAGGDKVEGEEEGGEEHLDVTATYELSCAKIDEVKSIGLNLFQKFASLKSVHTEITSSDGQQSSVDITGKDPNVTLKK